MVTLDDPDKLNVLSAGLTRQLRSALDALVADRAIRAIVLTAAVRLLAFQRSVESLQSR